jgi:hypothetical protein
MLTISTNLMSLPVFRRARFVLWQDCNAMCYSVICLKAVFDSSASLIFCYIFRSFSSVLFCSEAIVSTSKVHTI